MKKKKKRKKIITFITLFIIIIIILIYLASTNKIEIKIPFTDINTTKTEKKKITIYDEDSNKRPIAVMIDNNVGYSSQVGLQDAFVTYEAIVEGGLTRMMAIFKDTNTSLIGPVRSSRHYFLDYALEYDSLYAHYGWSTFAENDIKSLRVNNINGLYVDSAYWRDRKIAAPHNVFTNIETLYKSAENLGYQTITDEWEALPITSDNVDLTKIKNKTCTDTDCDTGLVQANKVTIPYSNSQTRSYAYDSERKVYLRYMNHNAHIDRDSKEQYHYKNIIIIKVKNKTLDSYGRQDLDTTGTKEAYYITNGYAIPITAKKDSRSGKTIYNYMDGSEVKLNDGNTFIQIEPVNMTPSFE
ncbi:MAG: DUF3048 domain-containing protein [Clostridium sp.]|nr:DUF3048 domain-containing protein [Clostridium sp.]